MNGNEKENNSRQSNYRCGNNGGIYLTLGIGKRSGQNPFSLCSEMMRILRPEHSGFVLYLLKQEPQTSLRRRWIWDQEIWFSGQHTAVLLHDPEHVPSMLWTSAPVPGKKWVMIPIRTVSQRVSWKTNELMDLQERDAMWGSYKDFNVHDSSYCLVFIRLVLGQARE